MGTLTRFLRGKLLDLFDRSGFCQMVGGRAVVVAGFDDLQSNALPLIAEALVGSHPSSRRALSIARAGLGSATL